MPKYLIVFLFFSLFCIKTAYGQNDHKVGVFSSLSTKQKSALGFALKYQWQYNSSFALESQYSISGDINIKTNSNSYIGDQSLLSIGAVFLKEYTPALVIKFSGGANYVVSSSNESFIQQSSISPYLKLALEYKVSNNFFVEAGQTSYFQSDILGNHHNFFIGLNYLFTSKFNNYLVQPSVKKTPPREIPHSVDDINLAKLTSSTNLPLDSPSITNKAKVWVLQLGAYTDELNADQALIEFKSNSEFNTYRVKYFSDFFRIVSPSFESLSAAKQSSTTLMKSHGVTNIIKQLE